MIATGDQRETDRKRERERERERMEEEMEHRALSFVELGYANVISRLFEMHTSAL